METQSWHAAVKDNTTKKPKKTKKYIPPHLRQNNANSSIPWNPVSPYQPSYQRRYNDYSRAAHGYNKRYSNNSYRRSRRKRRDCGIIQIGLTLYDKNNNPIKSDIVVGGYIRQVIEYKITEEHVPKELMLLIHKFWLSPFE